MTDLAQIQALLANLSQDVEKMSDTTGEQLDVFMGALDDIAAHTLAVQAILIEIIKKNPVEVEPVLKWIDDNTVTAAEDGEGASTAKALAKYLITGKTD